MEQGFTHFDDRGNAVMADVSAKDVTVRTAIARGTITMNEETFRAIQNGTAKKGDVLAVARIAGIMAAKRAGYTIPLCHLLNIDTCTVDFNLIDTNTETGKTNKNSKTNQTCQPNQIEAICTVKLSGKTGAEMEALTGVSAALLTIYDMCKALDRSMVMGNIRLWEKSGGKSGHFIRDEGHD